MMTARGRTLITPCAFKGLNTEDIYILVAIGETLCNKPRYDGLIMNLETRAVEFRKDISFFVLELYLDFPFDEIEMNK